jgi:hypothetical protein
MESFYETVVQRVVEEGLIKYMPMVEGKGGNDVWENVLRGIEDIKMGRRGKGEKVVVQVGNERWGGWEMC